MSVFGSQGAPECFNFFPEVKTWTCVTHEGKVNLCLNHVDWDRDKLRYFVDPLAKIIRCLKRKKNWQMLFIFLLLFIFIWCIALHSLDKLLAIDESRGRTWGTAFGSWLSCLPGETKTCTKEEGRWMETWIGNWCSYSYFPVFWSFWYISHSSDLVPFYPYAGSHRCVFGLSLCFEGLWCWFK